MEHPIKPVPSRRMPRRDAWLRPPRKPRNRPEQVMQRQICKWLLDIESSTKRLTFFHPANGGYRTKAEAGIFKSLGVRAGVPDLVVMLKGGRTVFFELKHGKKSQPTEKQKSFMESLIALGFSAYVISAENSRDAIKAIEHALLHEGMEAL